MKSCLLCGVGGQGTVLASRIIAAASIEKGLFARTAETIGMAQRGGSVVSHVRIGETVTSPMIPKGRADVLIGFEPGEALRNLCYLKPEGTVILCDQEIKPITASLGESGYDGKVSAMYLQKQVKHFVKVNGKKICEACGSPKVLNVAMVGALAASGAMNLDLEDIEKALKIKMKPSLLEINLKALHMGAECVQEK